MTARGARSIIFRASSRASPLTTTARNHGDTGPIASAPRSRPARRPSSTAGGTSGERGLGCRRPIGATDKLKPNPAFELAPLQLSIGLRAQATHYSLANGLFLGTPRDVQAIKAFLRSGHRVTHAFEALSSRA